MLILTFDLCLQPPMGEEGGRRRRHSSSAGDEGRRRRHPSNTTSKPTQASKSSSAAAPPAAAAAATATVTAAAQSAPKENAQKSAAGASAPAKKTESGAGKKPSAAPNKWSPPPGGVGLDRRGAALSCGVCSCQRQTVRVWRETERGWLHLIVFISAFHFKASKHRQWAWICAARLCLQKKKMHSLHFAFCSLRCQTLQQVCRSARPVDRCGLWRGVELWF